MALVRILVAADYSPHEGRFKSSAFTQSSADRAISCFDRDCANGASGGPCQHIARFYPGKIPPGGGPVYFWEFDPGAIPAPTPPKKGAFAGSAKTHQVIQSTSDSGDVCHYGIIDLSESVRKRFFKEGHHNKTTGEFINIFRCSGGQLDTISNSEDIPELDPE
jgi:hypothetical protein